MKNMKEMQSCLHGKSAPGHGLSSKKYNGPAVYSECIILEHRKKLLDRKFHVRRPVGRPRLRWEDNVRTDFPLLLMEKTSRGQGISGGEMFTRGQGLIRAVVQLKKERKRRKCGRNLRLPFTSN